MPHMYNLHMGQVVVSTMIACDTCLLVVFVCGVIWNCAMFYCIHKQGSLHTHTNRLIMSILASNLINCTILTSLFIVDSVEFLLRIPHHIGIAIDFLIILVVTTFTLTHLAIRASTPDTTRGHHPHTGALVLLIWTVSSGVASAFAFLRSDYETKVPSCGDLVVKYSEPYASYAAYAYAVCILVVPLSVYAVWHLVVYYNAKGRRDSSGSPSNEDVSFDDAFCSEPNDLSVAIIDIKPKYSKSSLRESRLHLVSFLATSVCWLPYFVTKLLRTEFSCFDFPVYLINVSYMFIALNSLISPVMLYYQNKDLREKLREQSRTGVLKERKQEEKDVEMRILSPLNTDTVAIE